MKLGRKVPWCHWLHLQVLEQGWLCSLAIEMASLPQFWKGLKTFNSGRPCTYRLKIRVEEKDAVFIDIDDQEIPDRAVIRVSIIADTEVT